MEPIVLQIPLGPLQTNCFLAADRASRSAVVIDPGWDAPRLITELNQRQWQLHHILLTHAHFDHIGAVADLAEATGAPVSIHALDVPLLRSGGGAREMGLHLRPVPEPVQLLEPGTVVEAGPLRFQVLFVPGHTPGHVAFYLTEAAVVFSGDVLFKDGIGRTDFPGGDYATLMRSIRQVLFTLPDATQVCSGHGPLTTVGEEKRSNPFLADV